MPTNKHCSVTTLQPRVTNILASHMTSPLVPDCSKNGGKPLSSVGWKQHHVCGLWGGGKRYWSVWVGLQYTDEGYCKVAKTSV